jgi:ring-1,2-phenylacetyl-CoA epoxidase subunit PaaD
VVSVADEVRSIVGRLPDPEIPVLTLDDLGIVRDVCRAEDGRVVVSLTPTYSGCPAIDPIREAVAQAVREEGYDVEIRLQLAPAWTTDWMSDAGRDKLRRYGIAPPRPHATGCLLLERPPACPRCGSRDTRQVSRFGATPCQAHHVCRACLEPFDAFKAI